MPDPSSWNDQPASQDQHELNTGPDGIALTEPHEEPLASPRRLRIYVAALVIAPVLYLISCIYIMRTDTFLRRTHDHYLANLGYGMKLHNMDCQVLIYGDSSAMVGVDPTVIQQQTGL